MLVVSSSQLEVGNTPAASSDNMRSRSRKEDTACVRPATIFALLAYCIFIAWACSPKPPLYSRLVLWRLCYSMFLFQSGSSAKAPSTPNRIQILLCSTTQTVPNRKSHINIHSTSSASATMAALRGFVASKPASFAFLREKKTCLVPPWTG